MPAGSFKGRSETQILLTALIAAAFVPLVRHEPDASAAFECHPKPSQTLMSRVPSGRRAHLHLWRNKNRDRLLALLAGNQVVFTSLNDANIVAA